MVTHCGALKQRYRGNLTTLIQFDSGLQFRAIFHWDGQGLLQAKLQVSIRCRCSHSAVAATRDVCMTLWWDKLKNHSLLHCSVCFYFRSRYLVSIIIDKIYNNILALSFFSYFSFIALNEAII